MKKLFLVFIGLLVYTYITSEPEEVIRERSRKNIEWQFAEEKRLEERFKDSIIYVYDGDTFLTRDHGVVRLIGADARDKWHGDYTMVSESVSRILTGRAVELEFDFDRYDGYGRTLAYVFLGDTNMTHLLIHQGWACTLRPDRNTKYMDY
ncbi:MAG: thermonuclease family protein [Cyclobacteriaceae bacterium]|nr:thermonuclease family protein [Cyclobacteriaceae bacterium]